MFYTDESIQRTLRISIGSGGVVWNCFLNFATAEMFLWIPKINPPTTLWLSLHRCVFMWSHAFCTALKKANSWSLDSEMFRTYIVKAIFIYFTKNCDDVTGTESQFSLSKKRYIWSVVFLFLFTAVCQRHQIYWGLMSLKCCASFSKSMWCITNTSVNSVPVGGLLQL